MSAVLVMLTAALAGYAAWTYVRMAAWRRIALRAQDQTARALELANAHSSIASQALDREARARAVRAGWVVSRHQPVGDA